MTTPLAKPQIFGLHFSGGNVYSLQNLMSRLKNDFEIELLELPGRGKRLDEDLLYTRDAAVVDLLKQIRKRRKNVPYLIYGHSMGAELGFIVTYEQERANDAPVCFIPTGNAGPNVHVRENHASLPRDEFFKMLKEMGGISDAVFGDEELMSFFEPILRADFELLENAEELNIGFKIKSPVHAMMGSNEKHVEDIKNWKNYTEGEFHSTVMEGNHFFINDHPDAVAKVIRESFQKYK